MALLEEVGKLADDERAVLVLVELLQSARKLVLWDDLPIADAAPQFHWKVETSHRRSWDYTTLTSHVQPKSVERSAFGVGRGDGHAYGRDRARGRRLCQRDG